MFSISGCLALAREVVPNWKRTERSMRTWRSLFKVRKSYGLVEGRGVKTKKIFKKALLVKV